jgi:hypothetical protein
MLLDSFLGGVLDVGRLHDAVTSITSGSNGLRSVLDPTIGTNASGSRVTLDDLNADLEESCQYDTFQKPGSSPRARRTAIEIKRILISLNHDYNKFIKNCTDRWMEANS